VGETFVGIDASKLRNAGAIADSGRGGEVRYPGELPATEAVVQKLVAKLAAKYRHLTLCCEAGPAGYGLYRLLKSRGHECPVAAPSLVPKKAGDRVKTNRRDAVSLAKLLRANEPTAVSGRTSAIRRRAIFRAPVEQYIKAVALAFTT
jgi:transposase